MRTKIRVNDQWYKPVPWHNDGECDGCVFNLNDCINGESKFAGLCDDGQEFSGHILIATTKEAMAEYIAKKLEGPDEMG